jgi:hypothetical protein
MPSPHEQVLSELAGESPDSVLFIIRNKILSLKEVATWTI